MTENQVLHCLKPGPIWQPVKDSTDDMVPIGSMCMRSLGHAGDCDFAPNNEIEVECRE